MNLRADHVAGATFVIFGAAIIALSGDLPVGQLSMPGSGFMPMIVAALTIVFGLALVLRAAESPPLFTLDVRGFAHSAWRNVTQTVALLVLALAAALLLRLGYTDALFVALLAFVAIFRDRIIEKAGAELAHTIMVIAIAGAAVHFYTRLGFIVTMIAMIVALLVIIERRNPLRAGAYSVAIVMVTYACFVYVLKTPLPGFDF
ncbi:MAG: hypothetical protein HY244_05865 [Rhizobiales bacterium]|nr:hypothetical protein [Hyphomicrobiales bacterium]